MAILRRLLSVGGEKASFLLPTFCLYPGSNHELVQQIDRNDNIVALEFIQLPPKFDHIVSQKIEVSIGGPAVWAFRDQHGQLHVGNAAEVRSAGRSLLAHDLHEKCPMAAAEMLTFCTAETEYPHVLSAAFAHLESISKLSAETWRDTVILLPLVKQDLEDNIERSVRRGSAPNRVFAFAERDRLHIHLPKAIAERVDELPKCRAVAKIFGIREFVIHALGSQSKKAASVIPTWVIYGVGGIARHVIGRPPFVAFTSNSTAPYHGALASGNSFGHKTLGARGDHLIIGIVPSDIDHAHSVNAFIGNVSQKKSQRHAFNVRPSGFGTPRTDKPSPQTIREIMNEFDYFWILANHRKHQIDSPWNSLAASNAISRLVKTASCSLIECLDSTAGRNLLDETRGSHGFGLIGASRCDSSRKDNVIRSILYSMLCEDAYLHSASKIHIFWPFPVEFERRKISLGTHQYRVEILSHHQSAGRMAVGYATNVVLSERSNEDFKDFCVSLLAGYGWMLRRDERSHVVMQSRNDEIRVWPVTSTFATNSLRQYQADGNPGNDLIISNQSISSRERSQARSNGWTLIHYSEIARVMRSWHGLTLIKSD